MINYRTAHTYQTLYQVLGAQNDQAVNPTVRAPDDYNTPPSPRRHGGATQYGEHPRRVGVRVWECQRREEIP